MGSILGPRSSVQMGLLPTTYLRTVAVLELTVHSFSLASGWSSLGHEPQCPCSLSWILLLGVAILGGEMNEVTFQTRRQNGNMAML